MAAGRCSHPLQARSIHRFRQGARQRRRNDVAAEIKLGESQQLGTMACSDRGHPLQPLQVGSHGFGGALLFPCPARVPF